MGLIDWAVAKLGYTKAHLRDVPNWLSATGDAEQFTIPDRSLPSAQLELYQRLTWIQIAIENAANVATTSRLQVKQIDGEESENINNHPFEQLLQRPNPLMSRSEFIYATLAMRAITGNCYWWLNKASEKSAPDEIWILPSNKVTPVPDRRLFLKGYLYEPDGATPQPLDVHEVVHFKRFHPLNSFVGLSIFEALATDATSEMSMAKWNARYFDKGFAKPPGALAYASMIDDPTWEKMKADIKREHGGTERRMMMLRGTGERGVSWVNMAITQRDMEFLSGRQFTKELIYAALAPGLASMLDINATEANSKAGKATFIELGVYPHLVNIAEKVTNDILPLYGEDLVAEFDDIRVTDRAMKLQEQSAFAQVHTIDEIRSKFYQAAPIGDERGKLLVVEVNKPLPPEPEPERTTLEEPKDEPLLKPAEDKQPEAKEPEQEDLENEQKKALKSAQLKAHTSVMVSFFMPANVSVQLAELQRLLPSVAEVVPASELHLTLTILGKAQDYSEEQLDTLRSTLKTFVSNRQSLSGTLNGIGRFHNAETSDTDVIYASFDSKDLPEFRQSLVDTLQSVGLESPSDYGYIPHVTLGYVPREATTPMLLLPSDVMVFDEIWLSIAGQTERIPFNDNAEVEVERQSEIKAFKRWLKKRPSADIHEFKAHYLTHDELHEIAGKRAGNVEPDFFIALPTGSLTREAVKALLLQLDPNDDEAEQKIRDAVEKRFERNLNKVFREMVDTLYPQGYGDNIDPNEEAARIQRQFRENQRLIDEVSRAVQDSVDLGISVAVEQLDSIGFGFDYTLVHEQARAWALQYTDTILAQLGTTSSRVVGQAVSRWVSNGEPLQSLINDLEPVFGRKRAARISATEVTRAYYEGTVQTYRESGVIKQLEWRTARDERTCPVCAPLHGQRTPLGQPWAGGIKLPAHPNCRCWAVPYVE